MTTGESSLGNVSPAKPVVALRSDQATYGRVVIPRKVIQTYDDEEWEVFIEEWVTSLSQNYDSVQRFGGTGDRGVDVVGFKTSLGFEGEWDCFQGKHYDKSLTPSIAWPEILKMFLLPIDNENYLLPEKYYFIAPKGVGTLLNHLLKNPTELRKQFLDQVENPSSKTFKDLDATKRDSILTLAGATDFSRFDTLPVHALLEQHGQTPYYVARFGGGLPDRPDSGQPPSEISNKEATYIRKLVDAYAERHPEIDSIESIANDDQLLRHFRRQRESFFRAEALESFARDRVPPATFGKLQDEVFDAVIETVEADHDDGLTRLKETLTQAVNAQLTANALIQVTEPADRKGICHQLANNDRVNWVSGE